MSGILVVGSVNMDVVAPVSRAPKPGETILIGDVVLVSGGKGANAAVAAARHGGDVRFIGAVGDDVFGAALRRGLEENGVDCSLLQTSPGGSGTAVILLDAASRQNSILVGPGANFRFTLPADDAAFRGTSVLMMQLETPLAVNREAARRARTAGVFTILDPAPAQKDLPDDFLADCDLVSPNETELEILTGRSAGTWESAEEGARTLLARGVKTVVVKMGGRGALWMDAKGAERFNAFSVEVADTTAAGDAFTGALAAALARKSPRKTAMREALAAGALACSKFGAQPSLPTRAELDAFLRARPA